MPRPDFLKTINEFQGRFGPRRRALPGVPVRLVLAGGLLLRAVWRSGRDGTAAAVALAVLWLPVSPTRKLPPKAQEPRSVQRSQPDEHVSSNDRDCTRLEDSDHVDTAGGATKENQQRSSALIATPATITALVPARNEQERIGMTIEVLLRQEVPDWLRIASVVVVANNCRDATAEIARRYAVTVVEVADNPYRKSGAFNLGWSLYGRDTDYVFTMDDDTVLMPDTLMRMGEKFGRQSTGTATRGRSQRAFRWAAEVLNDYGYATDKAAADTSTQRENDHT